MKAFIFLFTIVLLAPLIQVQAQVNSKYTYRGSYPQYYFVRTVRSIGIIPSTSIQVIDKDGRSISCSSSDLNSQNKSRQLCTTDSLINTLETCADCKIVKTKEQVDIMYNQLTRITSVNLLKKCPAGYAQATYTLYQRSNDTYVPLWIKISKGCGITDEDNKLINDVIREFEKQGDYSLLITQNNALAAKQSKSVSDSIDKNFVPEAKNKFSMPLFYARITTGGVIRFSYSEVLTGADVVFYGPSVRIYGENGYETSKGINNIRSYILTKKSGSDFYEIDINNQHYNQNYKIEIIPVIDTEKKPGLTLRNTKVQEIIQMK